MAEKPIIKERSVSTMEDLLYAIHEIFFNQFDMAQPDIIQYGYASTTHDLLANIFTLVKNSVPGFLPAGSVSYSIPANAMLDKLLVIAPTGFYFSIGTTPGGSEVADIGVINGRFPLNIDIDGGAAGTTIYFTGVQPDTIIKPFIR